MGTLTIYVLSKNKKIISIFHWKIIVFAAVKLFRILHGRVFVMYCMLHASAHLIDVFGFRRFDMVYLRLSNTLADRYTSTDRCASYMIGYSRRPPFFHRESQTFIKYD